MGNSHLNKLLLAQQQRKKRQDDLPILTTGDGRSMSLNRILPILLLALLVLPASA